MKRVGVYARMSTKEQSPHLQVDALRGLAAQRGWELAAEYIGVIVTKAKRPELNQLMRDMRGQGRRRRSVEVRTVLIQSTRRSVRQQHVAH